MQNKILDRLRRLLGYLIDWYIISVFLNVVLAIYTLKTEGVIFPNILLDYFDIGQAVPLLGLLVLVDFIYFGVIPVYLTNGQTLGKKLMKLRVVTRDDRPLSIYNALFRHVFGFVIIAGAYSPISNYFRSMLLLLVDESVVKTIVYISVATGFISAVPMLFDKENRMLHDIIGKTKVIQVNSKN